jgi:hypothetical protein
MKRSKRRVIVSLFPNNASPALSLIVFGLMPTNLPGIPYSLWARAVYRNRQRMRPRHAV